MSEPFWVPLGAAVPAGLPLVTALPGSPYDGEEIILTDSLTAGTFYWHLRYVEARATNKWVFVGGSPLEAEALGSQSTGSTSYVTLTGGPTLTLPVAGEYLIEHGYEANTGTTSQQRMSYDIGATAAVDADAAHLVVTGSSFIAVATMRRKTLTAVTLTTKYKVSASTGGFQNRWIKATPVAIGG